MSDTERIWRAKDFKAVGLGLLLCGVHDGRGKVCGRDVGSDPGDLLPLDRNFELVEQGEDRDIYFTLGNCPKHGPVFCDAGMFLAANKVHGEITAVHFQRAPVARRPSGR